MTIQIISGKFKILQVVSTSLLWSLLYHALIYSRLSGGCMSFLIVRIIATLF